MNIGPGAAHATGQPCRIAVIELGKRGFSTFKTHCL
jgi:hypothetical protein